jgi:diacylglycerol kinase (ATP)
MPQRNPDIAISATSAPTLSQPARRVFVALNPLAGSFGEEMRQLLGQYFPSGAGCCQIYEIQGEDDLAQVVRSAVEHGFEMVVAAGGDGTVSAVANGLIGTETPLGILPLGTANVLARELGIPVELGAACELLAGEHATTNVDAMEVASRAYFTQVGTGIDAFMIRDTKTELKRRFGRLAYIVKAITTLIGFQPRRFTMAVDSEELKFRASQVLVANSGILGQPPLRWGPDIRPDDGRLDVCIVKARTALDYLRLFWHVIIGQHKRDRNVRYLVAKREVNITAKHALPVQADGEIIGETPVQVRVLPGAVRVVVPASAPQG